MRRHIFALYKDYLQRHLTSPFRFPCFVSVLWAKAACGCYQIVVATKSLVETWVQVVYGFSFLQVNGRRFEKNGGCMPFLLALGCTAVSTKNFAIQI